MTAQQVQISLDFSREVAQLGELMGYYGAAPEAARTSLANAIGAVSLVVTKKASLQRDFLDRTMVPGPLSPEALGREGM